MATNPRIPEDRKMERPRPLNVIEGRRRPGDAWNGVIAALAVILVLLAVVIYFLPRSPKMTRPSPGAEIPAQATGAMLQVQGMQMAEDPSGRSFTLQGHITNNGTQTVNGAMMHIIFHGVDEPVAGAADVPVQVAQLSGKGTKTTVQDVQPLVDAPMKPNDSREFRVQVSNVPKDWNHQMPEISFSKVTSHS